MATLKASSITKTSVTLTCSGAGPATTTRYWYCVLTASTASTRKQYGYNKGTSHSITFTGLEPGTRYTAECRYGPNLDKLRAWADNGSTSGTFYGGSTPFQTDEEITYNHSLSLTTSATYNTISATVTLDSYQTYDVKCTLLLDGGRELEATIPAYSLSRTRTWTTNIESGTRYTITLKDELRGLTFSSVRRTKNNFSWSTSIVSGGVFNLKASDWNKFTSQLSDKASYYGITYNPATVNKGDTLTAEKFNNIVATINKLVDGNKGDCITRMSSVSKGEPVTASCIKKLATCLNE